MIDFGVIGQHHNGGNYFRTTIVRADSANDALQTFAEKYPDFDVIELKKLFKEDTLGRFN